MKAWVETQEGDDHGDDVASEGDHVPFAIYTNARPECVSE